MHCYARPIARSPAMLRAARGASLFAAPTNLYAPRLPSLGGDFAPFLRMIDDLVAPPLALAYAQHGANALNPLFKTPNATYQPRFDVREAGTTYELCGELPGVSGLEVQFTDPRTLVIRGTSGYERSSAEPSAAEAEKVAAQPASNDDAPAAAADAASDDATPASPKSSYRKPSVEGADLEEWEMTAAEPSPEAPAASATADAAVAVQAAQEQVEKGPEQPAQGQYWFRERSTGSFQRVFKFGGPVDVDNVKASYKDGLLCIVVPKEAAPAVRSISVE